MIILQYGARKPRHIINSLKKSHDVSYLILHHRPLLCRPAVIRIVGDGGGTAKVAKLNGALLTYKQVLNLGNRQTAWGAPPL